MRTFFFSSTGAIQTITIPENVFVIRVKLWGAGGGGGSANAVTSVSSGGGGAGGYLETAAYVIPGEIYAIVVGGGGSGGTSGLSGNSGGDTTFTGIGKIFIANGGAGGQVGTTPQAAGGIGGTASILGGIGGYTSQGQSGQAQFFGGLSGDGGDATAGG